MQRIQEKNKVKLNNLNSEAQMKKVSKFEETIEKDRETCEKAEEVDAMVHSSTSEEEAENEFSISQNTRTLFNLDKNISLNLSLQAKGAASFITSTSNKSESALSAKPAKIDFSFVFSQLFDHVNSITSEQ